MKIVFKFFIFLLICLSFFVSGVFLGYLYGFLKIKTKACPISLKEGLDKLFDDFPETDLYYENYIFVPLKNKTIVVKKVKRKF